VGGEEGVMVERETKPRYRWEHIEWDGLYLEHEPPDGYRLHSWAECGTRAMVVCWERVDEAGAARRV
jgi:hypothetical protein